MLWRGWPHFGACTETASWHEAPSLPLQRPSHRVFSDRRSVADNTSRSVERKIAAKPLSASSRSRSSTQSPPARFRKISASTIWGCPASPASLPHGRSDGSSSQDRWLPPDRDRAADPPARSARCLNDPLDTGSPARLVAASHTPLVMVVDSQTQTISLISQGQRGTKDFRCGIQVGRWQKRTWRCCK
jgi:hypothetical protein